MEQKNTIVKCQLSCLWNHNGICDQYVISIDGFGKCCQITEAQLPPDQKTCQSDCIHFLNEGFTVEPICLFKHPEPLKNFYLGMPCNYYHKKNSK